MRIGGVVPPREVAARFGLDVVLGAFLAGMVLRRWAPDDTHCLEEKVNAIDYGFSIPVFFVMSGMNLDVDVLRQGTTDELRTVAQLPCEREVYGGRVAGSVSVPPERTQEPREGATQGGSGRARPRGR